MNISFIIPAYNTEEYLHICLDSILRQPYDDYEIILINDGSTDKTQGVIDEYCRLDSRIRPFYQENAGQGASRSFGIQQAKGNYIWFVDSDDWLLPDVFPRISKILGQQDPDVLLANYEYTFDDQPAQPSSAAPRHLLGKCTNPRKDALTFASVSCWNTPPWRLICRRSHLLDNNIVFAKGVFYEDHPFAIHLMLTAKTVYVDGPVSYGYYQRATSTTKVNDKKSLDFLTIRLQCLELFRKFGVYDDFASIVVGYLSPGNFYDAHVSPPYQKEFIQQLHDSIGEEEYSFIEKHGDDPSRLLAQAAKVNQAELIPQLRAERARKNKYSKAGAIRLLVHLRQRAKNTLTSFLMQLRDQAKHHVQPARVATYYTAGPGTLIEDINVDVRVNPKSRPYLKIGEQSHVGGTYVFERGIGSITIGDKSSIGGGCLFVCTQKKGIHIGSNVMLSWNCTVIDSNSHSLNPEIRANDAYDWKCGADSGAMGAFKDWSQVDSAPIYIEDNVWIGFDVAIMKGVRIGRGAVVGSKSVVTKDLAPNCIYAGNPARFVSFVPRDKWTWEEIIHAAQGNPKMAQLLSDAYLDDNLIGSLDRYRSGDEFKSLLNLIQDLSPAAENILDVGGGNGIATVALALAGYKVTLVEPSIDSIVGTTAVEKLIALASEKYDQPLRQMITMSNAKIENFESEMKFDIAHCRQVVHHFTNPVRTLEKIHSLLTKDGYALLIREHVAFDKNDLEFFLDDHAFNKYTQNEYAYRPDEYKDFILASGMKFVQSIEFSDSPINYYPHTYENVQSIDPLEIAGRPYSFIAQQQESL